ncbi:MAG: CTP synthase [Candidatus Nealsonbacteria bacterium CG_4_9_14_3_um_filter_35_11]|uniref:CTP synthase n=1 Tax=Candidatus Nealsonbacteria bacterium CG11_big_fil_rev_8_21_14_0_20_35_11 TaxID=1974713 RepID=A0A2H0MZ84_9BACT|nr:MAG: CTP synthetase [Candidatus Nealsonbacteria bacterium CG11_big_fil_rev_8_21_14_0_20_35_11]PJA84506.1 MAG: CTP synthase [Candidatus Nealsonbacteria bacterium CG_4_9_14_3_um_filter_35_11]
MARFIFVAGGVMSGIGKGVATASIGKILQAKGFRVSAVKIDPYINVDAGTMNPIEHGEVFVTDDGVECDQDVGNYERFLDENLTTENYITTGRVYQTVINKERNLGYGGRCVEVVPDIPNEVIYRIKKVARNTEADFVLIEIGGTVGEYQNLLFLEAARILRLRKSEDILFILVSYLPIPAMIGEMKSKPTQTAVRLLNEAGIQPDIILARARVPLDEPRKKKISIFCNVAKEDVISAPDVKSIYEIPINFEKDNIGNRILNKFGLRAKKFDLKNWAELVKSIKSVKKPVKIGIVGKYFETGEFTLADSYISVIEAIKHAAWFFKRKPEIDWLSSEKYENSPSAVKELKRYNGIIVPGGFGSRGVEGKIKAIEFCRKNKIPFLGLCLGMQLAVIEFARNVCNLKNANSTEFLPNCQYPVIELMLEQKSLLKEKRYGGTMRLGAWPCKIKSKTISARVYKTLMTSERHRHRYELNNEFRKNLEAKGMIMAGINPEKDLVEIIEIKKHPFFVACQFHPEFKSRPLKPHPLFREFIRTATLH